jgi:hypothetical protein
MTGASFYVQAHKTHARSNRTPGIWAKPRGTGVGVVCSELYLGWRIDLTRRSLGLTMRREQFSVTIRRESPFAEMFLSGFSSKQTALAAARRRVQLLQPMPRPKNSGPHAQRTDRKRRARR